MSEFSEGAEHISTCSQLLKQVCPSARSLHGEAVGEHWWSGWPGAFCLKCGDQDVNELCLGDACGCPCHAAFWAALEAEEKRVQLATNIFGRWIIVKPGNPGLAWSGSQWVEADVNGLPDGDTQICNFDSAGEAGRYAIGLGFEVLLKPR